MGRTLGIIADRGEAQSIPAVVVAHEALGAHLTRLVLSSEEFASATTDRATSRCSVCRGPTSVTARRRRSTPPLAS